MNNNLSVSDTAKWLETHDNYLILTHIRPDGDTLGSAGALTLGLRHLGKKAYMLWNPEITRRYMCYLDGNRAPEDFTPEHVIAVDTATVDLIPKNASSYIDDISLCIDHHESNTGYAGLLCCLPDYASCGEIIFEVLQHYQPSVIDKKTADCLYVAISTDTGCFAYGNTTANTHAVAARLIGLGASSREINKLLFRTKKRERILIEGMVNSGIEFFYAGQVAMVTITRKMLETSGAGEDDIEDISNIAISIEGVNIGITIREMSSPADTKISVRTSSLYNASELCKNFGGGGHQAAAGATINKSIDEVKADLLAILKTYTFQLPMPDIKLKES